MEEIMRVILSVLLAAIILAHGAVAFAQAAGVPAAAGADAVLEQRYSQCIGSALCPLQERLQIVQEETNEMNVRLQRIFSVCAASGFQGCVDEQRAEMDAWHGAERRANQMMLSIAAQSLALKEAAAGPAGETAVREKTFWERLWGR
jgi:hypothetical protein